MSLGNPIGKDTIHLVVDMQRLFAETTAWHVPGMDRILPPILALARAHPGETLFTRFVTPRRPEDAVGRWRDYYRRWEEMTLSRMDPQMLDLVPALVGLARVGSILDKHSHGGFDEPGFAAAIDRRKASTLVVTGVETDVCVLATVFAATDRGYRAVVVADAVTSSSATGHVAALTGVFQRLDQQIEIATAAEVLAAWPATPSFP